VSFYENGSEFRLYIKEKGELKRPKNQTNVRLAGWLFNSAVNIGNI
jgi:hypothetical protein